jgi:chloramphenicol-sensitive protein RarD
MNLKPLNFRASIHHNIIIFFLKNNIKQGIEDTFKFMYKRNMEKQSFGKGIFFAVSAYLVWGILPLYWKLLDVINPFHILGYRILFSVLFVSIVLFAGKNTSWLKFYKDKKKMALLILIAITISFNWGLYIYAINTGHTIDTYLGYYINPLLSIVLGMLFFREKLKILQSIAFGLAAVGVLIITILSHKVPIIALGLALSFALYGLLKKKVGLPALESLGIETLLSSPIGLVLLLTFFGTDGSLKFPSSQGFLYWTQMPFSTLFLLLLCGFFTSLPLYLFSKSANMLPLSTLGFCQFLSPTMTFITGYFIFGESFPAHNFIAFGFIWAAVILYVISLKTPVAKSS